MLLMLALSDTGKWAKAKLSAGKWPKAKRFLGAPSRAVAGWLLSAVGSQALVASALAAFDTDVRGFRDGVDAWFEQGNAAIRYGASPSLNK